MDLLVGPLIEVIGQYNPGFQIHIFSDDDAPSHRHVLLDGGVPVDRNRSADPILTTGERASRPPDQAGLVVDAGADML